MKNLIVFFLIISLSLPCIAIAQVAIPEKVVFAQVKQNGWHLDSVQILFDGTGVVGLGTRPNVKAFFQATYKSGGTTQVVLGV